jgi:16S rRNA (cytosine1402-N4)-methyltransferase
VGQHHASHGSGTPASEGVGRVRGTGEHTPVLLERCLELLEPAWVGERPVHVDATVGLGGHAEAVLNANPRVRLIGLDRDPRALASSERRLAPHRSRTTLVHAVYDELPEVLGRLGLNTVDSVLFDLGVSSMQLDDPGRGFAYAQDAPLDMRMDPTTSVTAADVVNTYPADRLARVLRNYGEERFANRIAAAIVKERAKSPLTSSARLAELVRESIPAAARRTGGHPAKRTFQALRIEVNGELDALTAAMPAALESLAIGGRVVVLAYQSLEDRIVKRALTQWATSSAPVDLPVELPGTGPKLRLLTRGAELPDEAEVAENPRAASVRLRAAERIDPNRPAPRAAMRLPAPPTAGRRARRSAERSSADPSISTENTAGHPSAGDQSTAPNGDQRRTEGDNA